MDTMIHNVKIAELNTKIGNDFLNTKNVKTIQQDANVYVVLKTIRRNLMKT